MTVDPAKTERSTSRNNAVRLDLGPYYSDSQIKGARYLIIAPSGQPFVASIVAEVPDLVTARTIIDLWNAAVESPRSESASNLPGLRAAMRAIEKHRDDYAHENGMVDPTTNAYEARQAVMDRIEALDDAIEIINKLVKKEAAK